jgi:predicted  nucleic acid-binding Zn-ribbon protein
MSIPAQVLRLEQLDTEIEQTESAITEARRRRLRNPELDAAEARVVRLRENERAAALHQRQLEAELSDVEAKIKRDNTRMYSGQIVDPRELGSLERELTNYGVRRDELEQRVLEAMEHAEAFAEEIAASDEGARDTRAGWESERPAFERREAELAQHLTQLKAERESAVADVNPQTVSVYSRLRSQSGHAVSVVRNGVCQWCRVNIPQKDVQHARAGALVSCTNCERILYVGS